MINKKDNVNEIVQFLKKEKTQIVKLWVNKNSVNKILSKYNIGEDSFSSKVAVKIIDYFIEVLQHQKPVGHCPVMNDFIDYMFKRKITIKEIFIICMGLRRAIFLLIVSVGKLEKDREWIIELFSELFDQNLSGVLEYYENLVFQSRCKQQDSKNLEDHIKRLQAILDLQESAIFEVDQDTLFLANEKFYEIVGVSNQNDFMRIYPEIWSFIESVSCFNELFNLKRYREWIEKVIVECNGKAIVELFNYSLNQKINMEMSIHSNQAGVYAVVLHDITEYDSKMSSMIDLVYTDDMTQMPNIRKFDEVITIYLTQCKEDNQKFFLFLIDIHNFNDISEVSGRNTGDYVLKNFAKRILKYIDSNHFFARIDGNRFALLSKLETYEASRSLANKILSELHSITYNNGEQAKGNIAIVSCQSDDSVNSILNRADRVIQRIADFGSDAIMDDRLIIEEDRMIKSASKQFLAQCKYIYDQDDFLEVVNYFMEVPIDSKAKIIKIDDETIYVRLRKVAIHAINKNSFIYIKTKNRPHFKACVKDLDKEKLWVKLENFIPLLSSPLDRKYIRVKLLPTIEGILKKDRMQILVEIDTISVNSFSLSMVNIPDIKEKDTIEIETILRWDNRVENIVISGVVSKIKKRGLNIIIDIDLQHSKIIEEVLSPFIAHRQLEIIKQLRETIL